MTKMAASNQNVWLPVTFRAWLLETFQKGFLSEGLEMTKIMLKKCLDFFESLLIYLAPDYDKEKKQFEWNGKKFERMPAFLFDRDC